MGAVGARCGAVSQNGTERVGLSGRSGKVSRVGLTKSGKVSQVGLAKSGLRWGVKQA